MESKPVSITLKRDKDCKGSVRFATDDDRAPITNVYVSRALSGISEAQSIVVTVAIVEPVKG